MTSILAVYPHAVLHMPAPKSPDGCPYAMKTIATLTLNPTIDVSYEVERVFHTHKMRSQSEHYNPGGGGINVARVLRRLGVSAPCYYLSGGTTGPALDGLLSVHQLDCRRIPIAGPTRIATAVLEVQGGKEYRFTPLGPDVASEEWKACLEALTLEPCDYLVASGSLPPGVPDNFYARVTELITPLGTRMVLDSSAAGLRGGLEGGGIHLVKPSLGELRQWAGAELLEPAAIGDAAMAIVLSGKAENVAVTLGHEGALLAHKGGFVTLPAHEVEAKSAVGAGDSFLAAMVFGLAAEWDATEAFRFGLAAGAAAVLNPGTNLAHVDDIHRLFAEVEPCQTL